MIIFCEHHVSIFLIALDSDVFVSLNMCFFHVSWRARCIPMYFTSVAWEILTQLSVTTGYLFFCSVKVIWTDLFSLNLIYHFFIHSWKLFRWFCSSRETVVWLTRVDKVVGRSNLKSRYKADPRTLPWGTSVLIVVVVLCLTLNFL